MCQALKGLRGAYSLIVMSPQKLIAARDPIGIRPLYYGYTASNHILFASEPKNLMGLVDKIMPFPPGYYYKDGEFVCYCDITKVEAECYDDVDTICRNIHEKLILGVEKRLDADVPVGFLLSGGLDSPVAGYMMAKRGLELVGVHFFSYPYTSERAKDKVLELGRKLTVWCGRMSVMVVPFTKIQEEIRAKCHEELFTLIMRRFMMRIAERVAVEYGCGALITGESLGQVASQTMPAMGVTGAVCELPIFRPCIGMDKEEIVTIARKIDTFETSILPYEDCCTVFTPKHPNTKPKMPKILEAESHLDVDALVNEAVKGVEIIHLP